MNKEKQRIEIAKACGKFIPSYTVSEEYVDDPHWNSGFWETTAVFGDGKRFQFFGRIKEIKKGAWENRYAADMFPDYCNDLNAIHEAEKTLTSDQFEERYVVELGKLLFLSGHGPWKWHECPAEIVKTTAAQRAEAFLRTIGKWEES
jgi:hypothetical protein